MKTRIKVWKDARSRNAPETVKRSPPIPIVGSSVSNSIYLKLNYDIHVILSAFVTGRVVTLGPRIYDDGGMDPATSRRVTRAGWPSDCELSEGDDLTLKRQRGAVILRAAKRSRRIQGLPCALRLRSVAAVTIGRVGLADLRKVRLVSKNAYVYILASRKNGTLYTGVTNDLERRLYEHKHHLSTGFTSRYDVARLVWFVHGEDISSAIELEKKIKNRGRQWKVDLIEKTNPNWDDLSADWATPQLRAG